MLFFCSLLLYNYNSRGIMEEYNYLLVDGIKISYCYTHYDANNKLVFLLHGFGSDMDERGNYKELASKLLECKMDSIRFDYPGHGESTGNSEDFTIINGIHIIEALLKIYPYDDLSFVGTSYGGGLAAIYSWRHGVNRMVLWSPLLDSYHNVIEPENHFCKEFLGDEALKSIKERGYAIFGVNGKKINMNVFNDAMKYPCAIKEDMNVNKILILHGDKDLLVPYNQSARVSLLNNKISLELISGGSHCFYDETITEVINKTINFLRGD